MLMCNCCYSLFDLGKDSHDKPCPISGCRGSLCEIDSDISTQISNLSKALKKKNFEVNVSYSQSPKMPALFYGILSFSNRNMRGNGQNSIYTLQKLFTESANLNNPLYRKIISDTFSHLNINLSTSENPVIIENVNASKFSDNLEFKVKFNPLDEVYVSSNVFNLSIAANICLSIFRLELTSVTNQIHLNF